MRRGLLGVPVVILLIAGAASGVTPVQRATKTPATPAPNPVVPELTSPKHRDNVPRDIIDPPCKAGVGCSTVNVEGRVPSGLTPFLAVAPLSASPRMWIQPTVAAIRRDGSFDGIVYLGEQKFGIGERFTIYVFACMSSTRFRAEQVIVELPKDCGISDPVTVTRTK